MGEPITKEVLKKYKGWQNRIEIDEERIERARSNACFKDARGGTGSGAPSGFIIGTPAIDRALDLEARLTPIIKENKRKIERIDAAINSLDNPMEQSVLIARYIAEDKDEDEFEYRTEPMKWAKVAMMIYHRDDENAIQSAKRLHGRALLSIAKEEI